MTQTCFIVYAGLETVLLILFCARLFMTRWKNRPAFQNYSVLLLPVAGFALTSFIQYTQRRFDLTVRWIMAGQALTLFIAVVVVAIATGHELLRRRLILRENVLEAQMREKLLSDLSRQQQMYTKETERRAKQFEIRLLGIRKSAVAAGNAQALAYIDEVLQMKQDGDDENVSFSLDRQ